MAKNCKECKFYDSDYEWDEEVEDEIKVNSCEKNREEFDDENADCECFKKFRQRKYVEKDTKCDNCEFSSYCQLIECTTIQDTRRHFIGGFGDFCKKKNKIPFEV